MTPDDENLKKQLLLLPSAKILTIDAFCNDCLKSFPEEAGINPGYRLADAAEVLLLSREVFDSLCNAIFGGELKDKIEKKDFENLCDCLVDSRKMSDIFKPLQTVYNKIRTTCKGIGTFEEFVDAYSPDSFTTPGDTVFGKYITKIEKEEFHYRAKIFDFYAKKLSADPLTDGKYAEIAESEAKLFEEIA